MVIGLLILTAIPSVTGVAQAISAQRNKDDQEKDERRMQKFHIDVKCSGDSEEAKTLNNSRIVLKTDRLWIGPTGVTQRGSYGYVAEAFYIEYPDPERVPAPMGMVSQVRDDPPLLNWLYLDENTSEIKYGDRSTSIAHNVGPWDWTEDEEQIVFDDMEAAYINAFYAVERVPGRWQLFLDMKGDMLKGLVPASMKRLQVQLRRSVITSDVDDTQSVRSK